MARAVRMTLCRTWPPVAPARAMGEARPGRHQQHRWRAAEGGAAAARRARYVPALRPRAVQGRSSWIDVPPYAARCRFARRLSVHSGRQKAKARRLRAPCHSQCIAHRGACGKTRVVLQNLRPKPEPAEIRDSRSTCALVDVWVSLNVEPTVGLAVRLRELGAEVRVCAPPTARSSWPKCNLVEWEVS
jgi:hypothetical protein